MTEAEMLALATKVNALPAPDRLRLAAGLLDHRMANIAEPIIRLVADELALALTLAKPEARG